MGKNGMVERPTQVSEDAEKAVLGCMLSHSACIDDVSLIVRADDFYSGANAAIFKAVSDRWNSAKPVDYELVAHDLDSGGQLANIGGKPYLQSLCEAMPTTAHAEAYAKIVRTKSFYRNLSAMLGKMLHQAEEPHESPAELAASIEAELFALCEHRLPFSAYDLAEVLPVALDRIDERTAKGTFASGISTGLQDLDEAIGGLQNGELILIGARPSVGKTSLGLAIARHVAMECRIGVAFFSLEMPRADLGERLLIAESGVSSHDCRHGRLSADEMHLLVNAMGAMKKAKLWIDDAGAGQSAMRIASVARKLRRQHKIGLIIVDYVQLVEPETRGNREARYEQIGQVSRRLKFLAKELNCPIVAMAQVNRSVDERGGDKGPRLSDLRESGNLEQDADTVILLHQPVNIKADGQDTLLVPNDGPVIKIECNIAKNRNCAKAICDLGLVKRCMRFEDWKLPMPFVGKT